MENLSQKEIDYALAKKRVQQVKKFYTSLAIFIIAFAFLYFRKIYFFGESKFFNLHGISIVFWIWGIILAVKAIKIFFLNNDWERKMMNKELNQNKNGNTKF
jgi:hypothetical protein